MHNFCDFFHQSFSPEHKPGYHKPTSKEKKLICTATNTVILTSENEAKFYSDVLSTVFEVIHSCQTVTHSCQLPSMLLSFEQSNQ